MCLFVSASGASGQIYRLRKARAQAESGASERQPRRQAAEMESWWACRFRATGEFSEEEAAAQFRDIAGKYRSKDVVKKHFGFNIHAWLLGTRSIEES